MKRTLTSFIIMFTHVLLLAQAYTTGLKSPVKFCVISDPHLYDTTLGISGNAFKAYLAQDRKLLAESESILKSAVGIIENEAPSFLLVPGDLTKDGERQDHQKFAAYLKQLRDKGIKSYVVPGNHDVMNFEAFSFKGDTTVAVDHVTASEFASIYGDYGYREAIARDTASLSYVAEPAPGLWLLAMDACRYKENKAGKTNTYGKFYPATIEWIKSVIVRAKAENKVIIGMMHHGVTEHYAGQKLFYQEYVVDDYKEISRLLADSGVKIVFTGHYHAQDITKYTSPSENSLYDIETGSLVTYPCPVRTIKIAEDLSVAIRTQSVKKIDYNTNGADFRAYAENYLTTGLENLAYTILMAPKTAGGYGVPLAQASQLAPIMASAFKAHYSGDETPSAQTLGTISQFLGSGDANLILMGKMLGTLWTDLQPADNNADFNVSSRFLTLKSQNPILTRNGVNVINSGYGSSMALDPDNSSYIYLLTDRGPNADAVSKDQKVFPAPSFIPHIGKFSAEGDSLKLISITELKDNNGNKLTGLPNLPGFGGTGETAIDFDGKVLPNDSLGIDPEGLVAMKDGTFWISDEYGPHIIHFDSNGNTIERINPFNTNGRAIPKVFAMRRANRGMEGLAVTPDGKRLVGMMQSPLYNPSKAAVKNSQVTRIIVYDIATAKAQQYVYLLENINTANSEITAITDTTFLVLERDSDFQFGTPAAKYKSVYKINVAGATDISDPSNGINGLLSGGKTVEELNDETTLRTNGIVPVTKELVLNLISRGYMHDKAEGLVIINSNEIAVSNDDDFGINSDGQNGIIKKLVPTSDILYSFVDFNQVEFFKLDKPLYGSSVDVKDNGKKIPSSFELSQNYPNPFNPSTTISYSLPKESKVSLVVYDMLGRKVAELAAGIKTAGIYSVKLDCSNFSSGIYIYRLQAGSASLSKKMLLLK